MRKNVIVATDHEITSRASKTIPTAKYGTKKMNEVRTISKNECSKLMALQEALQDPIAVCEGS